MSRDNDVIVGADDVAESSLSDDALLRQLVLGVGLSTSTLSNATLHSASLDDGDTGSLKSISAAAAISVVERNAVGSGETVVPESCVVVRSV